MPAEIDDRPRRFQLPSEEFIFGTSPGMREVRQMIDRAAQDNLPVLIEGESGTGKETMGRFLHERSGRRNEPFLKLNGGVTQTMLEGKIFALDVMTAASGRETEIPPIGIPSKGTLFLDEVDGLDCSLQRKLAGTIESGLRGQIKSVEGPLSARVICATTVDLEAGLTNRIVAQLLGCFVHRIRLLPLRKRSEDIPQLCEYLLGKLARDFGRPVPHLSTHAVEALQQWKWPGNIRELENWIARIVIFGAEEVVGLEFRRQLAAGAVAVPTYHRAFHLKSVRGKRPRNHR